MGRVNGQSRKIRISLLLGSMLLGVWSFSAQATILGNCFRNTAIGSDTYCSPDGVYSEIEGPAIGQRFCEAYTVNGACNNYCTTEENIHYTNGRSDSTQNCCQGLSATLKSKALTYVRGEVTHAHTNLISDDRDKFGMYLTNPSETNNLNAQLNAHNIDVNTLVTAGDVDAAFAGMDCRIGRRNPNSISVTPQNHKDAFTVLIPCWQTGLFSNPNRYACSTYNVVDYDSARMCPQDEQSLCSQYCDIQGAYNRGYASVSGGCCANRGNLAINFIRNLVAQKIGVIESEHVAYVTNLVTTSTVDSTGKNQLLNSLYNRHLNYSLLFSDPEIHRDITKGLLCNNAPSTTASSLTIGLALILAMKFTVFF